MAGWLRHYCRAVRAASLAVADGGTSAACGRRTGVATVPQIQTNPMSAKRVELIRNALCTALRPHELDIVDESHLHAGHAGAREGKGHFRVRIVAECFRGQAALARHRTVYAALGALMQTDLHALAIDARSPDE